MSYSESSTHIFLFFLVMSFGQRIIIYEKLASRHRPVKVALASRRSGVQSELHRRRALMAHAISRDGVASALGGIHVASRDCRVTVASKSPCRRVGFA